MRLSPNDKCGGCGHARREHRENSGRCNHHEVDGTGEIAYESCNCPMFMERPDKA